MAIAVIEDDSVTQNMLRLFIHKACPNCEVWVADTYDGAHELAHKAPELWFVDMVLADGEHGVDLIKDIREHDRISPIVAMTSLSELKYQCLIAGANAFIDKPVRLQHVIAAHALFLR